MERCLHVREEFFWKIWKKNINNFCNTNKYQDEWYNLQSIVKKYTKIHETNGWDVNLFALEIITNANNPKKNNIVYQYETNWAIWFSIWKNTHQKNINKKKTN